MNNAEAAISTRITFKTRRITATVIQIASAEDRGQSNELCVLPEVECTENGRGSRRRGRREVQVSR